MTGILLMSVLSARVFGMNSTSSTSMPALKAAASGKSPFGGAGAPRNAGDVHLAEARACRLRSKFRRLDRRRG